jgi:molybdopterin/thiamine biosynthesis adenylyltransferase
MKPTILAGQSLTQASLTELKSKPGVQIIDIYQTQLKDLYRTVFPGHNPPKTLEVFISEKGDGDLAGAWVYYPWSNQLLHCLGDEDLFSLRTNRNKLLISGDEQQTLREAVVGIAGMSVGSGMAIGLTYSGISDTIKLADFDTIDTSNLNRLREPLTAVGSKKVEVAARHIYDVNPFSDVRVFDEGVDESNIDAFFLDPKLAVVVDEIDDFKMKVRLRTHAKKHGVPLLMFTSLGDNILIDVERYDQDPELMIFNGLLGDLTDEILNKSEITAEDARKYAVTLVGQEYVPTKAIASLLEMGKTLVGRPQLYGTIAVDSGLCTYLVRQLVLGSPLASKRYFVQFGKLFELGENDIADSLDRQTILKRLFG